MNDANGSDIGETMRSLNKTAGNLFSLVLVIGTISAWVYSAACLRKDVDANHSMAVANKRIAARQTTELAVAQRRIDVLENENVHTRASLKRIENLLSKMMGQLDENTAQEFKRKLRGGLGRLKAGIENSPG